MICPYKACNNLAFEHGKQTQIESEKGRRNFDHPMQMCHKENWDEEVTVTKADQEIEKERSSYWMTIISTKEMQDIG
jgi:hypothetical protein